MRRLLAPCAAVTALAGGAWATGPHADPAFAPGAPVPGLLLAVADFDGDGRADVAAANADNEVGVHLGDGSGAFRAGGAAVKLPAGPSFRMSATSDFDGDGGQDLVAVVGNEVTVLLGDRAGGLRIAPKPPISVAGPAHPLALAVGDVDGDAAVDLVVPVYREGRRSRVEVLLGDGSGGFVRAQGPEAVTSGQFASAVAVADFDSDAKADVAAGDGEADTISILIGDGSGRLRSVGAVRAGKGTSSLAAADFDGDGRSDLVVAFNHPPWRLTVLLGNGAGGFRNVGGPPLPGFMPRATVGDVDRDGNVDLVGGTHVLLGDGGGGFRPAANSPFALPADPSSVFPRKQSRLGAVASVPADLNGDGVPELVAATELFEVGGSPWIDVLWQTPPEPPVSAGAAVARRGRSTFATPERVTELAVDGTRIAVKVAPKKGCGHIVVWSPAGRIVASVKPKCWGDGWGGIALAGGQVAWSESGGGNTLEILIRAAPLAGGAPQEVAHAGNGYRAGYDPAGSWVGQLLGDGSLLAYNAWKAVCTHGDAPSLGDCDRWGRREEKLVRIVGRKPAVLKRGPAAYALVAVGGGRMAVEAAGVVTVLSVSGSRVSSVPAAERNPPRAVVLSRSRLAVQRTFTLDLYDPARGSKQGSLPLGRAAALELVGVNAKVALLRGHGELVLVRLRDGRLIRVPLAAGAATALVDAELSESGLFYAYNLPRAAAKGRVVFEPAAVLLARFGRAA